MKRASLLLALVAIGCGGGSGGSSAPAGGSSFALSRVVLSAALEQPIQYVAGPANSRLAYVLERPGRVRVLVDDALQPTPVLDLTDVVVTPGECGLAGMTLAPDFVTSRAFYLYYNTQTDGQLDTRVTRFTMSADGLSASSTGAPVFRVAQPFTNHKGGTIHFGPDGSLYLALGDGGDANDPGNRAQDPTVLLGKILRIDPTGDDLPNDPDNDYRIPSSNPFVGTAGVRGEIWAFGMRNPFRWSFDSGTGAMVLADVGQDRYEEIDYAPARAGGRNYGWRVREGLHASGNAGPLYSQTLTSPILEYDHSVGRSITGGYVYRGAAVGGDGYLFADYVANRLWRLPIATIGNEAKATTLAATTSLTTEGGWNGIVSIDPDANGEPIVVELNAGRVSRLVPAL